MPQVFNSIEVADVVQELTKNRGYGRDSCIGYAFRLNVRSKTDVSKITGLGFWEPVGGVKEGQLKQILATSRDVRHAADRVESICLGRTHDVAETDDRGGGQTLQIETVLHAVDNRIDAKLDPILAAITALSKAVGAPVEPEPEPEVEVPAEDDFEMRPPAFETPPPPPEPPVAAKKKAKKRGWPKGKKRGPRKKKAKKAS